MIPAKLPDSPSTSPWVAPLPVPVAARSERDTMRQISAMSFPQQIAHYRIVSKLGEGAMGAVYRATDTKLNRDVAIKFLPDAFAGDADRLARFTREAQVLAALNHPGIASIYGVEDRALVMELVEGPTLAERIAAGPVPPDEAAAIASQIAEALEYAHERGVIHRDLKPANIKLTPEGRVKVLDFGLAKAMASEAPAADPISSATLTMRATVAGAILGTPAYMSPEQARGQAVDKRSDIWSFGVVLYELLTGAQPFESETAGDTLAAVLTREPNIDLAPPRFRRLLRLCLTRDPRRRLRDISGVPLLLDIPASPEPRTARSRLPWLVALVASIAACICAGLWLRQPARVPQTIRFAIDSSDMLRLSPDGHWIVQVGKAGLQIRPLNGVTWRLLAGTESVSDAFWSPDSSTLAYFANGRLNTIALDGSARRALAPAVEPQGGSWRGGASDGVILFAAGSRLKTYDLRNGRVADLPLEFKASEIPGSPVFCPESENFLYVVRPRNSTYYLRQSPVYRSSLAARSGPGEFVLSTPYGMHFVRHPHTGRWFLLYVSRDDSLGIGNRALMAVPADPRTGAPAGTPVLLLDGMSNVPGTTHAAFDAAEGGVLLWRHTSAALPIWRLSWFDRNGNVTGTVGDRGNYSSIALSPDDSWIAAQEGYPVWHNWIYNLSSGAGRRLTALSGSEAPPVWSPDGRAVYFAYQSETGWQVMRQAMEAGSVPDPLLPKETDVSLSTQTITPDGRALLLSGTNDGAILRLDLSKPREARELEKLLPGAIRPRISPDGKSLIYLSGTTFYSSPYPVNGRGTGEVAPLASEGWPFFARDGRQLFIISNQSLYAYPVSNLPAGGLRLGERSMLFKLAHARRSDVNPAAITRDGQRILAIATDRDDEQKFQLLSDWTTLMK
jgi:serine/threonine-protein kinase